MGNSPVQGNLCTSQLALSTVMRNSHRDGAHRTNSGEKAAQQQDSPSICDWEPSSQIPSLSQSTVLRHPSSVSKHWFTTSFLHLQALVYHILPPSPSTGLQYPPSLSTPSSIAKHWFLPSRTRLTFTCVLGRYVAAFTVVVPKPFGGCLRRRWRAAQR